MKNKPMEEMWNPPAIGWLKFNVNGTTGLHKANQYKWEKLGFEKQQRKGLSYFLWSGRSK